MVGNELQTKQKYKLIVVIGALFFSILPLACNAQAGATEAPSGGMQACGDMNVCLNSIVQNTYQALVRLNNVPEQLKSIATTALSWISPDDSKATGEMQSNFASVGAAINANRDTQLNLQTQLSVDLFARGDQTAFTLPSPSNPKILSAIPFINDLTYASVLGRPLIPKAKNVNNASYNYIKNVAGINLYHPTPAADWRGNREDVLKYINYFSTTMAIQSFNGYIMSNLLAEYQGGNALSESQKALIAQASDSSWIAQIASEELGKVLRQLLMFESQSYILLTQLMQTEKQLLSAQVMTNSLLILKNQTDETILVPKAQGVRPTA